MRFLVTLLVVFFLSLPAFAKSSGIVSSSVGISIVKPAGWRLVSEDQYTENIRAVSGVPAEFTEWGTAFINIPAIRVAEHAEPYSGLNSTINVGAYALNRLHDTRAEDDLVAMAEALAEVFSDFVITEPVGTVRLGKHSWAHVSVQYTQSMKDSRKFSAVSELWTTHKNGYRYVISAGYPAHSPSKTIAAIRKSVTSLKIR